jgi:Protein of unknown function (DUF3455)
MGGVRRVAVGLAVASVAAIGVGGAAVPAGAGPDGSAVAEDHRPVPEPIRVPAGNERIAVMPARGVQTYQCTDGAWTFLQPDAILRHQGRAEVLHSRGPVWTSTKDGSSVTATAVANSPVENAIPQLLLQSTATRGPGLFAAVTFIQRLNTTGGLAPTGACTAGTTASIPYTADYAFWVAAQG